MRFVKSFLKRTVLNAKYRSKVKICPGCNITLSSAFEGYNYIGENTSFDGSMGTGSYIGDNCSISAVIGRYSCIAPNVTTVNGFHPTKTMVSVHPSFFSTSNCTGLSFTEKRLFEEHRYADENKKTDIIIGNDVWIGYGALIVAGVTIHDGAIIAAGSVVTKDVGPYAIVGGNPAKEIRKRFSDEQIKMLENIKWWDNSVEWIKKHAELYTDISFFDDRVLLNQGEK